MDKSEVLHNVIKVLRGKVPHLSGAEWDAMEEAVAPGSTAEPLTQSQVDQLSTLLAAKAAADARAAALTGNGSDGAATS